MNIDSYSEKVDGEKQEIIAISKVKLCNLLEKINNVVSSYEQLAKDADEKELTKALKQNRNHIEYCDLLTNLLANMFLMPTVKIQKFSLDRCLQDVFSILSETAIYNIWTHNKNEFTVNSDENLIKQIFFVLLKQIGDFLYGQKNCSVETSIGSIEWTPDRQGFQAGLVDIQYRNDENKDTKRDKNTILIVDDNETLLGYLKDLFANAGFDVFCAKSGYNTFSALAENNIDLIILDIKMEGLRGTEVLEKLRQFRRYKNIPVILYSRFLHDDDLNKFSEFEPIKVFIKDPAKTLKLIPVSKKLIAQTPEVGFKDFFDYDLENSILQDTALRIGFFPIMKIGKLLSVKIRIDENKIEKKFSVEIPSDPDLNSIDDNLSDLHSKDSFVVSRSNFELLFHKYKHDIRNKLYLVNSNIKGMAQEHQGAIQKDAVRRCLDNTNAFLQDIDGFLNLVKSIYT